MLLSKKNVTINCNLVHSPLCQFEKTLNVETFVGCFEYFGVFRIFWGCFESLGGVSD